MARKTKEEAEKTRQGILDAALTVFHRKGFVRCTLNDIAAEAGVTRGAIYWHFRNKTDLFLALSEDVESSAKIRMEDIPWDTFVSLKEVREFLLDYLFRFEQNPRFRIFHEIIIFKTEYHKELEPVIAKDRMQNREFMKSLEEVFQRLQTSGHIDKDVNPFHAAFSVCAYTWGVIQFWLFDNKLISLGQTAPVLIDTFLNNIRPGCQHESLEDEKC